ncbi:MAG: hypothetical protein GF384_04595, partial [Elusimicrobia bacterium]|nr:hypothetical protein [Elusimicrobiota bacterium]MBD3412119.1 hypothetical protein [Elusimicrobiota bacterium]
MNRWDDVKAQLQSIESEFSDVYEASARQTLNELSFADYWKEKLEKDRDQLRLRLKEKDDQIMQMLQERQEREMHIRELMKKTVDEKNIMTGQAQEIKKKIDEIENLHDALAREKEARGRFEQEIMHYEELHHSSECALNKKIDELTTSHAHLIEQHHSKTRALDELTVEKKQLIAQNNVLNKTIRELSLKPKKVREELDLLTRNVADHLRDLTTIASGAIQIVSSRFAVKSNIRTLLESVETSIDRMNASIDELLLLASMPEMHTQPTDINRFLNDIFVIIRTQAERNSIQCDLKLCDVLPSVLIDRELMTDCLISIIHNSIEALAGH